MTTLVAAPLGNPPIERFLPGLDVAPQNYCVVQNSRGIVFVCNVEGILEFDAEQWKLWRLPNRELVHSMAVAADDTVYVGGYNIFGYLRRNAAGEAVFEDLTKRFVANIGEKEFADIWETVITPEGVYFCALQDVFFWDPKTDKTAYWRHEGRFGAISHHNGKTLLQFRGEGIKVREGNAWRLLPGTTNLDNLIAQIIPLTGEHAGSLLAFGKDGKWWQIRNEIATAISMPSGMPSAADFNYARTLSDGSIAFSTSGGFIYIVDQTLKRLRLFQVEPGFLAGMHSDRSGGLLVVSANSLSLYRVAWPADWGVLSIEQSNIGGLYTIGKWNGADYALTSTGVYRIDDAKNGAPTFTVMPWVRSSIFAMQALDKDRILLAGVRRLTLVDHGKKQDIADTSSARDTIYPRIFLASRFRSGRIFVGTEYGLRLLDTAKINASQQRLSPAMPADLPMLVTHMVEVGADEVWVGTARNSVWRYRFLPDGSIAEVRQMRESDGLIFGIIRAASIALLADGTLIASTGTGIFRWEQTKFVLTEFDGLAKLRDGDDALTIVEDASGDTWAYSSLRLWHRAKSGVWKKQDIRQLRRGALVDHVFDKDGQVAFVNSYALLIHQRQTSSPSATPTTPARLPPRLQLRSVTRLPDDGEPEALALTSTPAEPLRFKVGDFSLRFEFALPEYGREGTRRYQGRLVGVDGALSAWASQHVYTYSSLDPGTYTMQIRALDVEGNTSEITPYTFIVVPLWYASLWAKIVYLLAGLFLIWVIVQFYTKRRTALLEKQNLSLETKVAARTRELADANRRLEMMAHVDGLTGIPNRRRLDEYLAAVWQNCCAQDKPLSVLVIDADRFKQYNDQYGHLAGDEILQRIAQRLLQCLRRSEDLLARYGGEEFIVVMPGAELSVAQAMAEDMRGAIELSSFGITISVGVSTHLPAHEETTADLIRRADAALYQAKNAGRNCVVVST